MITFKAALISYTSVDWSIHKSLSQFFFKHKNLFILILSYVYVCIIILYLNQKKKIWKNRNIFSSFTEFFISTHNYTANGYTYIYRHKLCDSQCVFLFEIFTFSVHKINCFWSLYFLWNKIWMKIIIISWIIIFYLSFFALAKHKTWTAFAHGSSLNESKLLSFGAFLLTKLWIFCVSCIVFGWFGAYWVRGAFRLDGKIDCCYVAQFLCITFFLELFLDGFCNNNKSAPVDSKV